MKTDLEKKGYLSLYVSKCKGNIKELEKEMERINFEYEEHKKIDGENKIEEKFKLSNLARNLRENFSKERAEETCKRERIEWTTNKNLNKPVQKNIAKNNNNNNLIIIGVSVVVIVIIIFSIFGGE